MGRTCLLFLLLCWLGASTAWRRSVLGGWRSIHRVKTASGRRGVVGEDSPNSVNVLLEWSLITANTPQERRYKLLELLECLLVPPVTGENQEVDDSELDSVESKPTERSVEVLHKEKLAQMHKSLLLSVDEGVVSRRLRELHLRSSGSMTERLRRLVVYELDPASVPLLDSQLPHLKFITPELVKQGQVRRNRPYTDQELEGLPEGNTMIVSSANSSQVAWEDSPNKLSDDMAALSQVGLVPLDNSELKPLSVLGKQFFSGEIGGNRVTNTAELAILLDGLERSVIEVNERQICRSPLEFQKDKSHHGRRKISIYSVHPRINSIGGDAMIFVIPNGNLNETKVFADELALSTQAQVYVPDISSDNIRQSLDDLIVCLLSIRPRIRYSSKIENDPFSSIRESFLSTPKQLPKLLVGFKEAGLLAIQLSAMLQNIAALSLVASMADILGIDVHEISNSTNIMEALVKDVSLSTRIKDFPIPLTEVQVQEIDNFSWKNEDEFDSDANKLSNTTSPEEMVNLLMKSLQKPISEEIIERALTNSPFQYSTPFNTTAIIEDSEQEDSEQEQGKIKQDQSELLELWQSVLRLSKPALELFPEVSELDLIDLVDICPRATLATISSLKPLSKLPPHLIPHIPMAISYFSSENTTDLSAFQTLLQSLPIAFEGHYYNNSPDSLFSLPLSISSTPYFLHTIRQWSMWLRSQVMGNDPTGSMEASREVVSWPQEIVSKWVTRCSSLGPIIHRPEISAPPPAFAQIDPYFSTLIRKV